MNRPKLQATGLLLGTFVAGAVVGGATAAFAELDFNGGKNEQPSYIELLEDKLNLTGHQRALAEEFISRYNDESHAIWDDVAPRYDELRANVRSEIMDVLDTDQRTIYEDMIARSDSSRAERRRKRHDNK